VNWTTVASNERAISAVSTLLSESTTYTSPPSRRDSRQRGKLRASSRTGMMTMMGMVIVESVDRNGLDSASIRITMGDRRKHINVNEGVHKYGRGYFSYAEAVLLSGSNPPNRLRAKGLQTFESRDVPPRPAHDLHGF